MIFRQPCDVHFERLCTVEKKTAASALIRDFPFDLSCVLVTEE